MKLFKYIGLNSEHGIDNCVDILTESKLWASDYRKLNDPFEYSFISKDVDAPNSKKLGFARAIMASRKGIVSFSSVNDDLLLWSHYGTSHRGLCFEFDSNSDSLLSTVREVKYVDRVPTYDPSDEDLVLCSKAKSWEYEREYRVLLDGVTNAKIQLSSDALKSAYFGVNVTLEDVKNLFPICVNKAIPCFQAERVNSNFSINFKSIKSERDFAPVAWQEVARDIVERSYRKSVLENILSGLGKKKD